MDYVLTYHVKKATGGRSSRQSNLLTENAVAVARSLRRGPKHLQQHRRQRRSSAVDVELGYSGGTFSSQEDQKTFRREAFERQLVDMGLELEKDEDVSLRCHFIFHSLDKFRQNLFWTCPHSHLCPEDCDFYLCSPTFVLLSWPS